MFARVKTVATGIFMLASMAAGQGYVLEWELTNLTEVPILPNYCDFLYGLPMPSISEKYGLGSQFDIENDGVQDIIVREKAGAAYDTLINVKIYDGATHSLKYTIANPFQGSVLLRFGFFDVDGDDIKEFFGLYRDTIVLINILSGDVEFGLRGYREIGVYDIDNDSYPEIWGYRNFAPNCTLQVWGSGANAVRPGAQPLAKQNIARLFGNAPNPFAVATKIEYYIPVQSNVQLSIFNAEGRLLRQLVSGLQKIGEYSVLWDGRTESGQQMASGAYFYRLQVGDFVSSKKMFILK